MAKAHMAFLKLWVNHIFVCLTEVTLSYGDIHTPKMWSLHPKKRSFSVWDRNPCSHTFNLTWDQGQRSGMYATHCLMVIHPCAKFGNPSDKRLKIINFQRIQSSETWFLKTCVMTFISKAIFFCWWQKCTVHKDQTNRKQTYKQIKILL